MTDQSPVLIQARIDIGRLEVEVAHLRQGMEDLQESNNQLTAKIDQVSLALSAASGGWKTLMLVGGLTSTVGGAIAWAISHFIRG